MDIRKLQRVIVDGLEDVKAHDIRVYNTEHLSSEFERVIVASGTSNRQTKALAVSVRDAVKSRGLPLLSVEGEANGEWIIVDCGSAVAHIMQPAIRQYYNLEEIWGGKAVHMKLGSGPPVVTKIVAKAVAKAAPKENVKRPQAKAAAKKAGKRATPKVAASASRNRAPTPTPTRKVAAKKATKAAPRTATKARPPRKAATRAKR